MEKIISLENFIKDLRYAARALYAIADGFEEHVETITVKSPAAPEPTVPEPKPITLEQVRAVLADKSRAGHTDEVRTLLNKHGAEKLSEIDPKEYAALLADAEVLGNG